MASSSQRVEKPVSPEPQAEPGLEPGPGRELQSWQWLVFYLCFYGFMSQMRPGESFITPYLLGPAKNFTKKQKTKKLRGCWLMRRTLRMRIRALVTTLLST